MRKISVITVGRSDFGIYMPILRLIRSEPGLRLQLIVGGAHLAGQWGSTVDEITRQGFEIAEEVNMLLAADTPVAVAMSMGLGTIGFAQAYTRLRPDIVLVLGDRVEMHAAAVAAIPLRLPLAHIHGGEITEGAVDDVLRHAITKYSHLHFVSTEQAARRVIQMGEEAWRVTVSGAPGLDNLQTLSLPDRRELEQLLKIDLTPAPLLVTFHPVTLEHDATEVQMRDLLEALEQAGRPILFTYPNADARNRLIVRMISEFVDRQPRAHTVKNLGTRVYFGIMSHAAAMVGNSSSGIIEAASVKLPVVNVGTRQQGRYHDRNVIDVGYGRSEILEGIRRAVSPEFRARLADLANPYGDGKAAERIIARLRSVALDENLLRKRFHDLHAPQTRQHAFEVPVAIPSSQAEEL